jgi:ribose 5-phosphate isomerase B
VKIAIGSDHAGYPLKEMLISYLLQQGHEVDNFGTDSREPVDYPDFVFPAAKSVAEGKNDLGIVLGGSGNGEAMTANRIRGVRCAVCWSEESARLAKKHNDANAISLGAWLVDFEQASKIVTIWLNTEFEGGRHLSRIRKLDRPSECHPGAGSMPNP